MHPWDSAAERRSRQWLGAKHTIHPIGVGRHTQGCRIQCRSPVGIRLTTSSGDRYVSCQRWRNGRVDPHRALAYNAGVAGRGSARIERTVRVREVGGSNPPAPTSRGERMVKDHALAPVSYPRSERPSGRSTATHPQRQWRHDDAQALTARSGGVFLSPDQTRIGIVTNS